MLQTGDTIAYLQEHFIDCAESGQLSIDVVFEMIDHVVAEIFTIFSPSVGTRQHVLEQSNSLWAMLLT